MPGTLRQPSHPGSRSAPMDSISGFTSTVSGTGSAVGYLAL